MKRSGHPIVLTIFLLCASLISAQSNPNEEQGLKPYDSWHGGDLDSVSMTNGGLVLHIPLVSFPQRGSLDLSFMIRYSSKVWQVRGVCQGQPPHQICTQHWLPAPNTGAQIVSSQDWWLQRSLALDDPGFDWTDGVTSPDGNTHQFGVVLDGPAAVFPLRSLDSTGLLFDGTNVILPNGTRYNYTNGLGTSKFGGQQASIITDANGNQITVSATGWTDTLGRVIPGSQQSSSFPMQPGVPTSDLSTCPTGTASALVWNVPGPANVNAGIRTYKFCYSNFTIQTNFNPGTLPTDYSGTMSLLSAVVLPDFTMWTFGYDSYADITRVGFPTGGSISYTYVTAPITCATGTTHSVAVAHRTVDANDGTGGHQWAYNYNVGLSGGTTKVTSPSPDFNDTVHTISNPVSGACGLYDTQVQYYQGSSTSGTLLKTVATQYNGNPAMYQSPSDGTIYALNVVPTQVTVSLPGTHTSKIVNGYDQTTPNSYGDQVRVGSLLQKDEYDFSNTLVRSTVNHFLWEDNSTYKDNNLVSLPVSSTVENPSGCELAKTAYGYDETYLGNQLQSSQVSMHHVAAPGPVRGNHTSTSRWLISPPAPAPTPNCTELSPVTSHTIPYDTGEPYQSYDPLNHLTQYTYDPAFYGAYLTQTNMPDTQMPDQGASVVHHIISGTYDFNTGLLTRFTDENSQNFTYTYDGMLRLTQAVHPDAESSGVHGQTTFSYPDPNTVTRQELITSLPGNVWDTFTAKFDGLGRTYQTQQATPSGTILVDSTYDSVGRVSTVSNPYYSGSNHLTDLTYGITTTAYDALSRVTQTTKQDHSISSVSYNDNCTTATDEAGKKRTVCTDALGRMTTVFEDPNGLNYETDYQYDLLNNLIRVDQKGSAPGDGSQWHTRLFTYDSLSRLITAQNPENGTLCYGIWSGGSCINGYDLDGNLLKKTDARNIVVTYAYDALNRLTDKTYSDSTPKASYRYDYASFLGQTFAYPIGREVATMVAGNTPEAFTSYDPMGRVKQTTQCNPGVTGCKTFTALYDLLGDLTSLAYPSGLSVTYQYDSAARLYNATDSSGWNYASLTNTSQAYFLPAGEMGEIDTPNFKYTNSFNSRLQPTEIAAKMNISGSLLLDKTYTYNPPNTSQVNNGNIYTVTNLKDSSRTQTFTYDALNRLASAQDAAHWSNVYTYDAWGNLGKKLYGPIPAGEHMDTSADTANHLGGYSYDVGGNVIGDGVNTYVHDGENRISSVAGVTYTYDADGRRVKKSSGTNYWYSPAGEALAETDSSSNWTNYIFFGGIRLARNLGGDIKYYISDHLHSTAVFADKTGTVLDDNDFYPWGGVVPGIGQTTSDNAIKFTGKYRDSESALDYFGARYYANVMGRFMSPDWAARPVTIPYAEFGDPQSLNLYSYVRNSPIVRVDPDGHDFINEGFQDWGFEMGDLRWDIGTPKDDTSPAGVVGLAAGTAAANAAPSLAQPQFSHPINNFIYQADQKLDALLGRWYQALANVAEMMQPCPPPVSCGIAFPVSDLGAFAEGTELVQLYGPFYRLDAHAQAIADTQMLIGTPARNIYASDSASVKAYFGTLPEGKPGIEFYTSEKPSSIGSGTQGAQVWWNGTQYSDFHFIPITPSRVVPAR